MTTKHRQLYDGDRFTHRGADFRVTFPYDEDHRAPWEEYDGHGIVSDWTTRPKAPGERVLVSDRDSRRYYDFQGTMAIALRDGWGVAHPPAGATKRQIAALAVERDYEFLRGWANDEWHYCGVVVKREDTDEQASLWGIEDSEGDYLTEVAYDLAGEILAEARSRVQPEYEAARVVAPWPDLL